MSERLTIKPLPPTFAQGLDWGPAARTEEEAWLNVERTGVAIFTVWLTKEDALRRYQTQQQTGTWRAPSGD